MVVLGTEQEYGIALAGADLDTGPSPMQLSNLVVRGYRDDTSDAEVGFDYGGESPLDDQWGFQLAREDAHPDLRTDELVMANRMLTNGARFYVDHAHPEFSGPEVTSWLDAVAYDRAGDLVMQAAADAVRAAGDGHVRLFKNNTDGKGQSYGSHENYLLSRSLDFADVVTALTPFLVARGALCGAGRVGIGRRGERPGYQLMQRGDFFEREVGIETTMRRPLINTRDEPHAQRGLWRRLHVITGDANVAQVAAWLRFGTTSLVLAMIEGGWRPTLRLADPVTAFRQVSHGVDPETGRLTSALRLDDGRTISATGLLRHYADAAAAWIGEHEVSSGEADADLLECWQETTDLLESDPMACADRLDWVAKLRLLQGYRARDRLGWDDARLAAVDLQYAEIDPARGLGLRLEASGALIALHEPEHLRAAMTTPPTTTRAWLRGELLRRHGTDVVALGWDAATLRLADGRRVTLAMDEPTGHARATAGPVLDSSDDLASVWQRLRG